MARILVIWSPIGRELEHMQLDSLKRTGSLPVGPTNQGADLGRP